MPQGARTPLSRGLASYSWGQTGLTQFAEVFQPGHGIFSPGFPLAPPEPENTRLWDFPVGVNTVFTPRAWEPVSFAELWALADGHDITRLAIETRKDQIERLDWAIRPKIYEKIRGDTKARPRADADPRIARLAEFWRRPDGQRPFATWLRELLEDVLVLDAPALEIRRNRGGDIIGLDVVDGATIKLLFDDTGRRPLPPAPAFEQVIHGRPWKLLTSDELIYLPRNPRPHRAYGFGPVEQIVMTINIGLRRQVAQLQHFTDGNVPPGLLNAPDGWSPDQIAQFQEWFDSVLAGNTASRSRLVWGPSGARYQPFKEAPYKDEFDEWLARIVCYAFSLPSTAFTKQVNRATAETVEAAALNEGLAPLMGWVKRLCDHVIQDRFGAPDLEFAWLDLRPEDPDRQSKILDLYVRSGIYAVNEARQVLGLDPVSGGDRPMVYGTQGPVPLTTAGAPLLNPFPAPPPVSGAAPSSPSPALRERVPEAGRPKAGEGLSASATFAKWSFNPDQPRVPAGEPDGGQWTTDGGGADAGSGDTTSTVGDHAMSITVANPRNDVRDQGSGGETTDAFDPGAAAFEAHIVHAGYSLSEEMRSIGRNLYRLFRDDGGNLSGLYEYLQEHGLKLDELPDVLRSVFDPSRSLGELQTAKPPRGFDTELALRAYLGDPPAGYEWHHLIEQGGQFRPDLTSPEGIRTWIQNTDNMVTIPVIKHYCISGWMSRVDTSGARVRDVVKAHGPEAQRGIGIGVLHLCGVIR